MASCALLLAFSLCLVIIVFSWPHPQDRKRAIGPKLAGCCEIRIANQVVVERAAKPPRAELAAAGRP